jgi:sulfoxide reductase heme-binding subunit YedZ
VAGQSLDLQLVLAILGFESLALLWLGIVTGFLVHRSWRSPLFSHRALQEIHQATAGLGLSLGAVHGIGQVALPGGSIAVLDLIVPFVDSDNRLGTGVAVVGSEVLAAIALSVIVKRRLGPERWRALHLFSYAAFMLIIAHVLISGRDVGPVWVRLVLIGAWLVTVALGLATTSRSQTRPPDRSTREKVVGWVSQRRPEHGDSPDVAVFLDERLCTRLGHCAQSAPRVFRLMDGEVWHRPTVSVDELEQVTRAAEVCPERAITLAARPTAERPALQSGSPVRTDAPRQSDISAVPGVRRRRITSGGE